LNDIGYDMMLIRRGAEAEIHLTEWLGRTVISKHRVPKKYRLPQLDRSLRVSRTKKEAKLISDARRLGVSTPIIYDIDLTNHKIIMEYIDGPRIKDILLELEKPKRQELLRIIGSAIGKLHKNHIVHGDLTTSNILYSENNLYFIDFSLGDVSEDIESKGVDLHLLMEAFESTHPELMDEFQFVLDGYSKEFKSAKEVINKIDEIIKRGRYT
jgi:Kae1-associated kinase Bud32